MSRLRTRTVTISVKQNITELIEQYGKYAWILHDKDTDENGVLKDPHYHIYLEFPNARGLNSIADELGIAPNMVQIVRDKKGLLAYLTHRNSPEKWQYDDSEIHANFEIKRTEEPLTMIIVHKLLTECMTFEEFLSELTHRGLAGNPIVNYSNCVAIWKKAQTHEEEEQKRNCQKLDYSAW